MRKLFIVLAVAGCATAESRRQELQQKLQTVVQSHEVSALDFVTAFGAPASIHTVGSGLLVMRFVRYGYNADQQNAAVWTSVMAAAGNATDAAKHKLTSREAIESRERQAARSEYAREYAMQAAKAPLVACLIDAAFRPQSPEPVDCIISLKCSADAAEAVSRMTAVSVVVQGHGC